MTRLWLEGFGLGLSTGPYCFTACAPLLVPYLLSEGRTIWKGNVLLLTEFIAGRLVAYLLAGFAAGWAGARWAGQLPSWLLDCAVLVSGFLMLALVTIKAAPGKTVCAAALSSRWARRFPLLLGFLVGINLCPPFVAGITRVLELGHSAWGAAYFAAFFVGTTLYLLPVLAIVPLAFQKRAQFIGTLACGLAGVWFTILGAAGILRYLLFR